MSLKTTRRRRNEARTDYRARMAFLKSEKPRIVIRKTNRYIIAQLVETDISQDKVIVTASSQELLDKGWPKEASGSLKSLPAAYLTGFLLGKKLKGKTKEAILDMGMNRNIHGSRIYAALKGVLDAGILVPHKKEALPPEERLKTNKRVSANLEKIKEKL